MVRLGYSALSAYFADHCTQVTLICTVERSAQLSPCKRAALRGLSARVALHKAYALPKLGPILLQAAREQLEVMWYS